MFTVTVYPSVSLLLLVLGLLGILSKMYQSGKRCVSVCEMCKTKLHPGSAFLRHVLSGYRRFHVYFFSSSKLRMILDDPNLVVFIGSYAERQREMERERERHMEKEREKEKAVFRFWCLVSLNLGHSSLGIYSHYQSPRPCTFSHLPDFWYFNRPLFLEFK